LWRSGSGGVAPRFLRLFHVDPDALEFLLAASLSFLWYQTPVEGSRALLVIRLVGRSLGALDYPAPNGSQHCGDVERSRVSASRAPQLAPPTREIILYGRAWLVILRAGAKSCHHATQAGFCHYRRDRIPRSRVGVAPLFCGPDPRTSRPEIGRLGGARRTSGGVRPCLALSRDSEESKRTSLAVWRFTEGNCH
jgi:hypothetical protein